MDTTEPAGIGHNLAAGDITGIAKTASEQIALLLVPETQALWNRSRELIDGIGRVPAIENDETSGKVADFVSKQLRPHLAKIVDWKDEAKKHVLAIDRSIMARHKELHDPLETAVKGLMARQTKYLTDKADRERREREAAAKAAAEEAAKAAAAMQTEADLERAVEAEQAAVSAQAATSATTAELSRVHGEYGGTASLASNWTFKDVDRAKLDLEALRPYLPMDGIEKAIRALIKAGTRELKGATIYQERKAR